MAKQCCLRQPIEIAVCNFLSVFELKNISLMVTSTLWWSYFSVTLQPEKFVCWIPFSVFLMGNIPTHVVMPRLNFTFIFSTPTLNDNYGNQNYFIQFIKLLQKLI